MGRTAVAAVLVALAAAGAAGAGETELKDADGLPAWLYTPTDSPDPGKTYWLVVGVHGVGGDGKGACGVASWAREFPDVVVLGPTFARPKRDPDAPRPAGPPRQSYQMSGPAHEAKLKALVAEVGKTWKLHPKVFLHGFSAGAQFAHRFAFRNPGLVAGVSAHSAGSWAKRDGDDRIDPAAKAVPFAVSCGEDDKGTGGPPGTPPRIEGCRRFAADLAALGFAAEVRTWPGVGHAQTAEAKAMGKALFGAVRGGPAATRVYIANDDHTDFMWTADADTYARTFVEMLDFHLDLARRTAGNPEPYRHRFNADGSYWLWCYERARTPAEFDRLIERVRDGTLTAPLNTVVACYGGQPVEAVLRGLSYAGRLERRYDLRLPLALAMENQTLPLGLASLFAGAGAKYSWRGVCGCASRLPNKLLGEREREIYWWTGPDGQRVLLKWYSLGPKPASRLGGYLEASDPAAAIRTAETDPGFRKRYVDPATGKPYAVVGLFGYGGDDLGRKTGVKPPPTVPGVPGLHKVISSPYTDHFHEIARRETTPERQVVVSNEVDFFREFEARYGKSLDSRCVTHGNEWDLYSASMAETTARAKRAVEKLRAAELLATLVSLKYPAFMDRFAAARDRAFADIGLYWEHNWTADGPVSRGQRAAWQEKVATDIEYYVDSLHAEAAVRLGGMIPRPAKAERFYVLNPLGWPRTGAADFPYAGRADIHVRDVAAGKDVPHQVVVNKGVRALRVLAADVPPAGYKVYEIAPGPGTAPADDAATFADGTFENAAVKLVIDRDGAVRSLVDKRRGNLELAAEVGGLRLNDIAPGSDAGDPLRVENRGPVSVTVRARSDAGLDHTTAITLYRDSDRVDVRNEITANFADVRHWAFGFALKSPAVRTEEVGALVLNKRKADGGDYADTHARYDYVTANHFADVTDGAGKAGVTLSNPDLAFARLGASTPASLDTATPQVNFLAGGQVDGRRLGIPGQYGATYFLQRFALRPHGAYDPAAAMRFALEHQNPLVAAAVVSDATAPTPYPEASYSLVSVSDPNVLLWAVKPADDGVRKGVVVRLWNVGESAADATLAFAPGVADARRTTHIETDLEPVPADAGGRVPVRFARQQIQTYRLRPTAGP